MKEVRYYRMEVNAHMKIHYFLYYEIEKKERNEWKRHYTHGFFAVYPASDVASLFLMFAVWFFQTWRGSWDWKWGLYA
jgi:hypothetical protein